MIFYFLPFLLIIFFPTISLIFLNARFMAKSTSIFVIYVLFLLTLVPMFGNDVLCLGDFSGELELITLPIPPIFFYPFFAALVLVTLLTIFFTLTYNRSEFRLFMLFISVIWFNAFLFFSADTLLVFFFSYEMFLLPSFVILYIFSKTRRAVEAAVYMFFWTQFGALALFLSFVYLLAIFNTQTFSVIVDTIYTDFDKTLLATLWFFGFGVKVPIWPFYSWLPRAHVEASTNFSIFLSGVLVKFAFYGLVKCFELCHFNITNPLIVSILVIGCVDATLKLFSQVDLKKMVAYMTVIEMHWLCLTILSGYSPLLISGLCMLFNHALLSTQAFFLVDSIARRFKTRLLFEIQGLSLQTPLLAALLLTNLLLFLGFPGTLSFLSEFLFFLFLIDFNPLIFILLLIVLYFLAPSFFFKNWFNVLFGSPNLYPNKPINDLTMTEFLLITFLSISSVWFAFNWTFLLL